MPPVIYSRNQHLDAATGPKRILALDGGGIRGILTLQYLAVIERLLRERMNAPTLRLCDYFDLIGGTSTGSIIAAGLACGMTVAELEKIYLELGKEVFEPSFFRVKYLVPKFPAKPVQKALDRSLGADTTLNSDKILTGLMVMTKRLDTGSPWPLHNHYDARYAKQDGELLLTQVVRASTAAPTYFEPQRLEIHSRDGSVVDAAFVDGGVSPFNDPALQLLMLAGLQGHGFRWKTGADRILLVSVGTGTYKQKQTATEIMKQAAALQGVTALQSLMDDCGRMNHAMMQWLTNCLTPWTIDRAVGDMKLDSETGPRLATYARYDVLLEQKWLKTTVEIDSDPEQLVKIAQMDDPSSMDDLIEIGKLAAAKQIKDEQFPRGFDLPSA